MQKIAYNLYRVSTKKQLYVSADNKEDIPMQRQACREFAKRMGWDVGKEFEEKGISGSKVSAEKRDAIQDLKDAALKGEFQILLVFMFDRIGRIDDETPFVVEWFVKHGIEVWSVNEGEQKFEHHVDKLMNYIRFWQAAGESEKTSIRTKTRLGQIVEQGCFRGGTAPFGYRLEKQGRINKNNREVNEIVIDDKEADIVRKIFDLYVIKGYGSQRIGNYLYEQGICNRKGNNFTNTTIQHMLSNKAYIGILKSGDTESDIFPHLQIIDPHTFETTQNILMQRSANYQERRVPLNTKGKSLLSGNIFCGHCGARIIITTSGKKYERKDGSITVTPRTRYVCYNRTRHSHMCDGQTGYTVKKLDAIIEIVVRGLFKQLDDAPKNTVVSERYASQIAEYQIQLTTAKATSQARAAEVLEYESEVIKIIRGESKLNPDLLNKLHKEAKEKAAESEQTIKSLEAKIRGGEQMRNSLSQHFDDMMTWADIFDGCDMETKKMILSRIMKSVKVKRGYEIEIDLTVNCEQLGLANPEVLQHSYAVST
ncbi:MAG: recombinase family protein [Clostridiales bacterium]|jgi:DNA invertase Pin-like site-specific DNA recombinase|nr:recombinase family protein [Clostridiales bacterium]